MARILFVLLLVWCGLILATPKKNLPLFGDYTIPEVWLYTLIALFVAIILIVIEYATDAISSHKLLMAVLGVFAGLAFSHLIYRTIPAGVTDDPRTVLMLTNLIFGYFGMILAIKHAERFHLSRLKFFLTQSYDRPKVLDTSVIIDGRIRDLIDLQVIRGSILVPEFVVGEIQSIADSAETGRRARGRRGLDVLETLRESSPHVELIGKDYPDLVAVDQKLIQFCREMDADLITNDFNLQKIAHLHRIHVININEIANSLRPAVYIGELMRLLIVREGKEAGQGVGYLDDGTMVIVDDANHLIGQEIPITVTSILQTSSGRLVFARLRDQHPTQGSGPARPDSVVRRPVTQGG